MFFSSAPPKVVLTPCIGICAVGRDGLCEGCLRTTDEIARWGGMDDLERARIMNFVLPARVADADR